jgi:hypothetical protein
LKTNDVDATDAKHANFSTQSDPEKKGMPRLDRCAQCNGPEANAPLARGEGYPPDGVHLHPECRRFWLADNRVGRDRFRKVAETPPGTHCVCCHSPAGEVSRIKDTHVVGGKSEPLHERCAPEWFERVNGEEAQQ